eukprot:2832630-Amphidinium_carterae.1
MNTTLAKLQTWLWLCTETAAGCNKRKATMDTLAIHSKHEVKSSRTSLKPDSTIVSSSIAL